MIRTQQWKRDKSIQRCEAMVTVSLTGRRCKYDAEPDSDPPRCMGHMWNEERRGARGVYMSRYYLKTLRPALAKKLEDALDEVKGMDQLDVGAELELMRVTARDAVEQYAAAVDLPGDKGLEARVLVGELLNKRLQEVADMVEKTARVQDLRTQLQGAFAVVMSAVISSVAHAMWETFGDDYRVANCVALIESKLQVKNIGSDGTELTPDRDVTEMDDTVPSDGDAA